MLPRLVERVPSRADHRVAVAIPHPAREQRGCLERHVEALVSGEFHGPEPLRREPRPGGWMEQHQVAPAREPGAVGAVGKGRVTPTRRPLARPGNLERELGSGDRASDGVPHASG